MDAGQTYLRPPENLASFYTPTHLRLPLQLLLAFDNRLAEVILLAREPMIAQIKLAWWSDAIAKPLALRPRGEPMIAQLADPATSVCAAPMAGLVDAWSTLAAADDWTNEVLVKYAEERAQALFVQYAEWAGASEEVLLPGMQWAVDDLAIRTGRTLSADFSVGILRPRNRSLRPLSILALSVRDVSGPRLLWHALTGR